MSKLRDAHTSAVDEFDAKQMWCPEVRRLYCDEDGSGAGINRREDIDPAATANCLGSKCMAWRWTSSDHAEGYCGKAGGS